MLQTIEVEIDQSGRIHPLEPLSFIPCGRAYLTLLPTPATQNVSGNAAQVLELLSSNRYARRPAADPDEVRQRIDNLRNEWGER